MANITLSIADAASGTANVTANNDTVTFSSTGWKGGTTWSASSSNCSVSPSSGTIPSGQGTVAVTVSNFTRSTSNGSWSVTVTGDRNGGANTTTAVGSGTINASTGSITISGMDANNAFGIGDTGTVSWTSNDVSAKGYNSTGTGTFPRFSPKAAANALSGTSGSFTCTAVGTGSGNPAVAGTNGYSIRLSGTGSAIIANSNSVVIHNNASAGTATATVTSSDTATGNFTVTGSTTATAPGTINYRFLNSTGSLMPGSSYSTTNSYVYPGSERNKNVEVEVREQIKSGSTVYSQSFTQDFVSAPYISPDRSITVNGNAPASPTTTSAFTESLTANSFLANAQTTDTIAIAYAQIGDEIRVVHETGALLVDFFTITATSFNIAVPTNTTRFPPGQSKLVRVQIRRSVARGGNNSNATALTYTYQRPLNQATARLLTSNGTTGDISFGSTSTIGATAYIAAANGSTGTDTAMDLVVSSGAAAGTDYRILVTSGTTNGGSTAGTGFTPKYPTGTSFTEFLSQSRLPNVNASVSYKIEARDNSSTGDGLWYECYRTVGGTFLGTQYKASFGVTRSNYVSPDTTISTSNSFTPTGSSPPYRISASSTSETVSWTGGSTGTEYFMQTGDPNGMFPDLGVPPEFGNTTGSTSGTITITESSGFSGLPESTPGGSTTDAYFTLYGRVPISANGTGQRTQIQQWEVRRDNVDTIILVNSVPANRFTISSQGSFTISISSGSSNTDYRVVLVSQTGTNLTVGGAYGSRTGSGNITLTGTPAQGEFATYRVQARITGTSGAWTNTSGANSTFTAGRYKAANFAGSSGGSITNVPINSSVATATATLSGVAGTAKVYVFSTTGNATVKVIKNTDTPVIATSSSPVNAVNGDIIGLQFTVGGGYSETSTGTIQIDQPLLSALQFGPVFSITTEASPTNPPDGGDGGTGNYGLEVRNSSGDLILTNSDLVGDFCYADTVSISSGGTTGISGVNLKGGNTVLIQQNLNPFSDNQRAEAVLQNSGKQVRINLVDATASQALTFNVLVFNT